MKRILNTAAKIIVSVGLIAYLFSGMDWHELETIGSQLVLSLFLWAIAFFLLSNTLGAVQWYLLLRARKPPHPLLTGARFLLCRRVF